MVLLAHTKERGTKFARPQPKAYMYLQVENMTAADNLIITAIATRLILQNQGYTQSLPDLMAQVKACFDNLGLAAAQSTYYTLERIQRVREEGD